MKTRHLSASLVAGVGSALGIGVPLAQATAPVVHHAASSAHMTKQALSALDARWNAQAAAHRTAEAELAQAAAYRSRLGAALALKALNARWNAQALYFGRR